jgi:hypothetical protein
MYLYVGRSKAKGGKSFNLCVQKMLFDEKKKTFTWIFNLALSPWAFYYLIFMSIVVSFFAVVGVVVAVLNLLSLFLIPF